MPFAALDAPVLAHGCGRSYGDVCLNGAGVLIDTTHLDRLLHFDQTTGVFRCEAGVTLEQILNVIVPRGWFLPVTPGTKFVTVGGAIANDVHGKNHHRAGSFGRHVTRLELLRSTGERIICSADRNSEMFHATIGGLGLTGLILWTEIQLRRVTGPFFSTSTVPFGSLTEFMELSEAWDDEFEYTVAWVDSQARGNRLGRGILFAGNHLQADPGLVPSRRPRLTVPFDFPAFVLSGVATRWFNALYYRMQRRRVSGKVTHYEPFLYPLDAINSWNRMYGPRGFFQYQSLVPMSDGVEATREILERVALSRQGAVLAVLKRFGNIPSAGLLSFPRSGLTLAVDLPNRGSQTLRLLDELDAIVLRVGGSVYPAKDARMPGTSFRRFFPQWESFRSFVDPQFRSDFWHRVTNETD